MFYDYTNGFLNPVSIFTQAASIQVFKLQHKDVKKNISDPIGSTDYILKTLKEKPISGETFKGTVARDFFASVLFMDLRYMGPRFQG